MKITIYTLPPSLNTYLRSHWAVKRRLRLTFGKEIAGAAIIETGMPMMAEGRVRIDITLFRPRLLDPDNAIGGCKPMIDSLRDVGIYQRRFPEIP